MLHNYLKYEPMIVYKTSSPKNGNMLKMYSSSAIQDVDEFVSSLELTHQWILCSEWVPSEQESNQLIKTSQ